MADIAAFVLARLAHQVEYKYQYADMVGLIG